MKKHNAGSVLIACTLFVLSSCQVVPQTPSPLQTVIRPTGTPQPAAETPTPTRPAAAETAIPTLLPVSEKSLAGLIISSPILGAPFDVPGIEPPTRVTANGLGIINADGRLTKFADAGLFESFSPSGARVVYQHGMDDEYTDHIDNLYVYNAMTGETTEIVDTLEHEGGKTVLSWSPDEQQFIYYNDYLAVLFEAFGYFQPRQLLRADIPTGRATLLIKDGYQYDVSPDGRKIAYSTGEILDSKTETYGESFSQTFACFQPRLYDIASSSSQPFDLGTLNERPICAGHPAWSPDGKKIAWMGYFENDTFRPIIFDLEKNTGTIYASLDQKPMSSNMPVNWYFGEPYFKGDFDPDWIDETVFWTPSYEVNAETGETSTPRELKRPYNFRWNEYLESPDGSIQVSLNDAEDAILISDTNGTVLASLPVEDLYDGPRQEILTSGFILPGRNLIMGWSPFIPPATR